MDHNQLKNQTWPQEGLERVECYSICSEVDRTLLHDWLTDKVFFLCAGAVVTISMPDLWRCLPGPKADPGHYSYGL